MGDISTEIIKLCGDRGILSDFTHNIGYYNCYTTFI